MPNWCLNKLVITGSRQDVERVIDTYRNKNSRPGTGMRSLSLAAIIPEPDDLPPSGEATPTWYMWRVKNWGCKWDIEADWEETVAIGDEFSATTIFSSAWCPPTNAIEKLASSFDGTVTFHYAEPGCDYSGFRVWEGGALVEHAEGTLHDTEFGRETFPPDDDDDYDDDAYAAEYGEEYTPETGDDDDDDDTDGPESVGHLTLG